MTATAAVAAGAGLEVTQIALNRLEESDFNPRKTMGDLDLADLMASILQHGITNPLLVRPKYDGEDFEEVASFEIVAGCRRSRAARLADMAYVPCIIREMTDDEAREIALIDNLQRADVPALEEADAFEALRQQLGTAEAIAQRVGKPIDHIVKRLRLVSLGAFTRQALAERLITVEHALLLARVGSEEEEKALRFALDRNAGSTVKTEKIVADCIKRRDRDAGSRWGAWEPESVAKLKAFIERTSGRALSRAPWDLDDAELLPAAGACTACPHNTAHNTSLFGDLAIEEATCEDGICFEAKRAAFVQIQLTKAQTAITLSWKSSTVRPKWLKDGSGPDLSKVLKAGQWTELKKANCDHAENGVAVDWCDVDYDNRSLRKPGEVVVVCVAEGCKAHPKAYEKKEQETNTRNSAADAALIEKNRELAIAENKLRIAFVSAALETVTAVPEKALRAMVKDSAPGWEEHRKVFNALLPGYVKLIEAAPYLSADFAKAVALVSLNAHDVALGLENYQLRHLDVKDRRKGLIEAVRALGYSGPTPWDKAEPKKAAAKKAAAKKAAVAPGRKTAVKKAAPKKAAKAVAKKAAAKKKVRK